MNKRLFNLNERKKALLADSRAIVEAAGEAALSAEQAAAFEKNESEVKVLNAEIEREERLAEHERKAAAVPNKAEGLGENDKPKVRIEGVHVKPKHFANAEDAYLSGRFIRAALSGRQEDVQWCRDHGLGQQLAATAGTAHSTTNNSIGGILVPDAMSQAIINLKEQYGVFRQNASVVQMPSETLLIPRRLGGVTTYYVAESTDATASKVTFDGVQLTARKLVAASIYPVELADSAVINLADYLANEFAYGFAKAEDQAGFIGDGTSTYGGIVGIKNAVGTAGVFTAATGNVSFETFDLEDYMGCMAKLPQYALAGAKWYISQAGYAASMARLAYAAGGNTVSSVSGGSAMQFLGYPVVISQALNATLGSETSTLKCFFGDLRLSSTVGDRMGFAVSSDRSLYFLADQVVIKGTQRFDIVNHDCGDTSSAGPVVALKTAAS